MGLVSKLTGSVKRDSVKTTKVSFDDMTDGALDTLSNVVRVMGNESFPLESDIDAALFPQICREFACHIENGAAVPSYDIPAATDGAREWGRVRRFFADRRHAEKSFVTERLQGYRGIVDDLVSGLRNIGHRDQTMESGILESLTSIEDAVMQGELPQIEAALTRTVSHINETFAEQKREYEKQLQELNERMSSMRQDLVAAREEMKRDSLTDAYNRGAFDSAIVQSLNVHFILQQPVTLLMIDVDHFKRINDTHGHPAGDAVLKAAGECLARSFIRKNDIIARYGGDEFAVILTDTSAKQAGSLIERFLQHARGIVVPDSGGRSTVSCSIGCTEVVDDDTVASVVSRADQALYRAKAAGRDCSVFLSADDASHTAAD